MSEMTMEAAIIAANRLLTEERMDIDREEMKAAIRKLIDAVQFRIKREPIAKECRVKTPFELKANAYLCCPNCEYVTYAAYNFCPNCGQALEWPDFSSYLISDWSNV